MDNDILKESIMSAVTSDEGCTYSYGEIENACKKAISLTEQKTLAKVKDILIQHRKKSRGKGRLTIFDDLMKEIEGLSISQGLT